MQAKVALVTGAARRLGRAIALGLGEAGAEVALHFGRSADQARTTGDELRRRGRRVELFQADLADPEQIAAMFARVGQAFGRLDVLVNNAAVYHRTPIETLTSQQWETELAINARAPALCMHHAIGLMPSGGAIINITDIAAERALAGYPAYCASKAALQALTRSAAKALAARNIRVNAVAPGVILRQQTISEQQQRKVLAQVPLKRAGRAEDVAAAVVFLARHDYITGQTLRVDGGFSIGD